MDTITTGVISLVSRDYLVRGAVMLASLTYRANWRGPIAVFTADEDAFRIVQKFWLGDARMRMLHRHLPCSDNVLTIKPLLVNASPFGYSVFLDSDAAPIGPIDELFAQPNGPPILTTIGRTTADPAFVARLRRTIQNASTNSLSVEITDRVKRVLNVKSPLVNTGVWACRRNDAKLDRWGALTQILSLSGVRDCDEVAMQMLLPEIEHRLLGSEWNFVPESAPMSVAPRILHFAGGCHRREPGRSIWHELLQYAVEANFCGLRSWCGACEQAPLGVESLFSV